MASLYKISEDQIDFDRWSKAKEVILNKITLRSVMAKYGIVTSASHVMTSCLFHDESIPSMSVSFDEGVWHCFSCQRGGTVIDLIRHTETSLHNNYLDRYTVVEFILQKYPEITKVLGFNSILKDPDGDSGLDLIGSGTSEAFNIEVGEQLTAKCQAIEGLSRICADLSNRLDRCRNKTSLFNSSDDESDVIDRILFVCEACELGLPESYIADKLKSDNFKDSLRIVEDDADISEEDAAALEDLLI